MQCLLCDCTFKQCEILQHYNRDCQEMEGVACDAAPYCKVKGTRGYILQHEQTCQMIRVECAQCKAIVTRKYISQHDCFESVQLRLKKL